MFLAKEICEGDTSGFCDVKYMVMPAAKVLVAKCTLLDSHPFTFNSAAAPVSFIIVTLEYFNGYFFSGQFVLLLMKN